MDDDDNYEVELYSHFCHLVNKGQSVSIATDLEHLDGDDNDGDEQDDEDDNDGDEQDDEDDNDGNEQDVKRVILFGIDHIHLT